MQVLNNRANAYLPCFHYGLEACLLLKSLEFVVNGVIRNIFCSKSNDIVNDCLFHFSCVVFYAIYT